MAGTIAGGKHAAITNVRRHGKDFYARIGRMGGKASNTGGFAAQIRCDGSCDLDHVFGLEHRIAQCAGYKGGTISRRGKRVNTTREA